jgi:Ca2+/Na+ antiporter
MDQIGTSHIATSDFFICGIAVVLFWYLRSSKHPALSRAIAFFSAGAIVAVVMVLLFADLSKNAVLELATIALWLCLALFGWNDRRRQAQPDQTPAELPNEPASGQLNTH